MITIGTSNWNVVPAA